MSIDTVTLKKFFGSSEKTKYRDTFQIEFLVNKYIYSTEQRKYHAHDLSMVISSYTPSSESDKNVGTFAEFWVYLICK